MHIAILIRNFPPGPSSGAESQAQAWAEKLSARHRVTVITRRDPAHLPPREQINGYTVVRPALPVRALRSRLEPVATAVEQRRIGRLIDGLDCRPDVMLCFGSYPAGLIGVNVGSARGVPAVVWIRSEGEYRSADYGHPQRGSASAWRRAAGVLVQSESGKSDFLAELGRTSPELARSVHDKLLVIGNGVDLPVRSPRDPDGPVLSVGRLIPDKGMDTIIDACAIAGRPLVIAGRGPDRAKLERRADQLGADVRFAGYVDREELAVLLAQASVFAMASRREGLPNAVLEAMAAGRPVVVTPCGGIPSLIADGVNGLLIPSGDSAAFAAALNRLAADPLEADRFSAAARRTAEQYAWDRIVPKLEDVLERWRHR